jgi:hypothetical protein
VLHLVLVHKVRRAKLDLQGSKEPQDHLDRQDQQDPQAQQDQKATRDPQVLPVLPAHLVQGFA